ncbi:RNase3 domain protein [Veillonellaceae bacterium DNF00626]|nr:RNase3 domain protein [Veillonellaceae bacterium DNF00626]
MEFKRVLFLKKQMVEKISTQCRNMSEEEIFALDSLTLAYMGDVCWSFFIRRRLIETGICHVQILHNLAAEIVSAKIQSQIFFDLKDMLSEREFKLCKRVRNAHSTVPKSATVEEYREATAFEGLLGYLYLSGQEERLQFFMKKALMVVIKELKTDK